MDSHDRAVGVAIRWCGLAVIAVSAACSPDLDRDRTANVEADVVSCVVGAACTTNPGGPCVTGKMLCDGAPRCVDDIAAADGTSCGTGVCALGDCLPPTTVSASIDLSVAAITPGRSCAEAPSYAVASLPDPTTAVLVDPKVGACLAAGDEVMLINLQGSGSTVDNVGNWELLRVASVSDSLTSSGAVVEFATARTRFYGATVGANDSIGSDVTAQKVAIVRVPRFGALSIAAGATVTTSAWNGMTGGVLALRAGSLTVAGVLDVSKAGYRAGRWSRDAGCMVNVATERGESIGGPAVVSTLHSFGAPGGIAAATGPSFNNRTPASATAGHATPGRPGSDNGSARTLGEPGGVYGVGDGSKLTLGSGASGDLTCNPGADPHGALVTFAEMPTYRPAGAGIVAVFAGDLAISGSVIAQPIDAPRDVAASGGYVLLHTTTLTLSGQVTAAGGVARDFLGVVRPAGDGYIVIQASHFVTAATTPSTHVIAPR
jgi:hypothetical protein